VALATRGALVQVLSAAQKVGSQDVKLCFFVHFPFFHFVFSFFLVLSSFSHRLWSRLRKAIVQMSRASNQVL